MLTQCRNTTTAKAGSDSHFNTLGSAWLRLTCVLRALMTAINMPLSSGAGRLHDGKPSNPAVGEDGPIPDRSTEASAGNGTSKKGTCPKPNGHERGGKRERGGGKGGGASRSVDGSSPRCMMMELASGICLGLGLKLLLGLQMEFSDKPNARYGPRDMYRMLLSMCCGSRESATAEGQYQNGLLPGKVRLPSRSWLLKKVGAVRHDHMLKRCQVMVRRTVLHAKRHGMLRHPVDVAIDEHDIPFHAKCMKMSYAVFSRGKKGTIQFNRLATIYCMVNGQRLTLGVEVVRRRDDTASVVRRLLGRCRTCGIRISSVTADRGFYSTAVMAAIREAGYPVVMPAVKHGNVKQMIRKFDAGRIGAVSAHTMSSGEMSESFKLVILRRQEANRNMSDEARALARLHKREICVEDKYYVFATTMPDSWMGGDPHRVAEFYRQRWSIENSYKSYEQLRPWTTSNSHSVRILLWFIPFVLYNLWMIARHVTGRQTGINGGRPPYPLYLFVSYMLAELNVAARSGRPPD